MDAQRQETRVTLYNVELGGTFDQDLFVFNPDDYPGLSKAPRAR